MHSKKMLAAGLFFVTMVAYAQDIDYQAISNEGFGDVAELLRSMTPEQQKEILKQAAIKQQDLKKMSPEELRALKSQLRAVGDTFYMHKIDPEKLDASNSKSTQEIQADLNRYQKKYKQNHIRNDVVKPAP